jgi:hypothetical protein
MDITLDNEVVTNTESTSVDNEEVGTNTESTPVDNEEVLYAVVRDEAVQGFCKTRERAVEVMLELADHDILNAPTNEIHRRVYDELYGTLKIYAQHWTLAIFPYERIEHHYFITPIKQIE